MVHLLEIAPEMTDADVAKLQDEDQILGPVKSMLSQGYLIVLPWMTCAPCLWKVENFGPCGPPLSSKIGSWSAGMAMPSSWWYHSLCATSCLLIRMPAHSQPTWARKECWRNYVAFTTGLACGRTSMPDADNVKDVP